MIRYAHSLIQSTIDRSRSTWLTIGQRTHCRLARAFRADYYQIAEQAQDLYSTWSTDSARVPLELVHPLWAETLPVFADMITHGLPHDFLQHPQAKYMFYRTGFGSPQEHELSYLRQSACWELVQRYRESPIGQPTLDCLDLNISVNSLGMLYYFARILEYLDQSRLRTIVEFGGGYGNLCRVFLELLPGPLTYVIIDLPEMLAIQYAYLTGSSPRHSVEAPTSQPVQIRGGSVNLVPVYWAQELALISCDLFISTFALSEAPTTAQNMVIGKEFFQADAVYLVGQHVNAALWRELALDSMEPVQRAASKLYPNVVLQPFHFADSWELLAWRNRP